MATSFKTLLNNDKTNSKTLLHESIPITGSIVSGTYSEGKVLAKDLNVKTYSHGMFESIYDYPYLSSSANHIFDLTVGYSNNSSLSSSSNTQNAKKINIYNQMAQVLCGHDATGNIRSFDEDGDFSSGTKLNEVFFINFARLLSKDEIKKGSFTLELGSKAAYDKAGVVMTERIKVQDVSGSNSYKVNSPAGEYGILYATGSIPSTPACGLIFYQAGIVAISGSVFSDIADGGLLANASGTVNLINYASDGFNAMSGATIETSCEGIRNRIYNISFNNTTELNSQIYFCRVNHNDFNYSSNPTYLSNSKLRVKNQASDNPVSYITTIGLYSASRELLAVAKLSEPLKNDPTQDITLRVRLDY